MNNYNIEVQSPIYEMQGKANENEFQNNDSADKLVSLVPKIED